MLVELLSPYNYVSFNIKVANQLGVENAIYISELMNINEKAFRKNKLKEEFFTIDRGYIQSRTTFSVEKQHSIEDFLVNINILKRMDDYADSFSINIPLLASLAQGTDEGLMKEIEKQTSKKSPKKPAKKTTKTDKLQSLKTQLQAYITTTNAELRVAYVGWIESVLARYGWMTTASVVAAQNVVDSFSNRDLDVALKLIEVASIHGYREMKWAVDSYNKDYKNSVGVSNPNMPQQSFNSPPSSPKLSDEVF